MPVEPPISLPPRPDPEPLVSVFTPVFNGRRYLPEAIESVLAQTYRNFELVIVDNASDDETPEIIRGYAARDGRIRSHRFEDYLPTIPNWNRSLRLLSPDSVYVKFLFADDWLYPECLADMVGVALANPSITLVGSYRLTADAVVPPLGELDRRLAERPCVDGRYIAEQSLLGKRDLFGSPSNVMYRADRVRARGDEFFDEAKLEGDDRPILPASYVNHHADTMVCYELLRDGDWGFVPRILTYTRLHDDTETARWTIGAGTWTPGILWATVRWGPEFCKPRELGRRVRELRRTYVIQLVKNLIKLRLVRDRRYRHYHHEALKRLRLACAASPYRLGPSLAAFAMLLGLLEP